MKFGIRECCDVVFRAKSNMKVGNKIFFRNEPVIYFDTLKTSTLEGAATTVYAQGGRGNARLMSWDGERTVTFTMEDALISPEGLAILTGAGLIQGSDAKKIPVHTTETFAVGTTAGEGVVVLPTEGTSMTITLSEQTSAHDGADVYVMILDANDNMLCEPYSSLSAANKVEGEGTNTLTVEYNKNAITKGTPAKILVDYYVDKGAEAMQINITPDKFGGAFYIEGSTLFREYPSQVDMPAEIIIPNGRVQSNFTFTMAGSGDPSTFTFTVDAFPDYTKFDPTEKVLASIQIISADAGKVLTRDATNSDYEEKDGFIVEKKN